MATGTPTETQRALEAQGVEVITKDGVKRRMTGDQLRMMSGTTVEAILTKFGPDMLAQHLHELATNAVAITKTGREVPDNRTRLAALQLVLAYVIGRPVERQEVINVNLDADSSEGLLERLKASPALRAGLRKILDQVDAEAA